jgi:Leucine-rich repeat (LRR) protein
MAGGGRELRNIFLFLCAIGLLSFSALAENYYIDHVAEENWTTSITVYNDGPDDLTFDLQRWDNSGTTLTTMSAVSVPANSSTTLTNADFGYNGTAMVVTPSQATLVVKLSYRYQDSHSLCEFFLPQEHLAGHWMLPNPYQTHFDWFGVAVANFTGTTANVTLKAWHNGTVVGTATKAVSAHTKLVDVSSGFWSGMNYADVDMVTMDSDVNIPAPVSITGNTEQNRHVFFLAENEVESCPGTEKVYVIPHVAESNWTTLITAFNNGDSAQSFTFSSWNGDGTADVTARVVSVPAHGRAVLSAGTDFVYSGTASIVTNGCMHFKLSYRYGESESLCEFFLSESTSTQWFIPNSIHTWFDWFGLAMCNPTDEPIVVAVDAYKDGAFLEIGTKLLEPHTKTVGLANDFWPNISKAKATEYDDVDMVVIRSSAAIPAPLSITGNEEQDRHVFFLSSPDEVDPDFPDPAFKAYVLENFDTNEDGTIDSTEADAVYLIDTPGSYSGRGNIKDITGVEIFTKLQQLEVAYEQLSWIPELTGFPLLSVLTVDHNYLVMIPDWTSLTNLSRINCGNNMLTEIPPLAPLVNLQRLHLQQNQLSSVPDMTGLNQLTWLELYKNNISELTGTSGMTEMLVFSIGSNNFDSLPDISAMTKLTDLHCDRNNISSLPDMSTHPQLYYLIITDNNISSVTGLSGLTNMSVMDLSKNPISTLEDLSNLDNMVQFDIAYTDIASVPGLGDMDSLTLFYCDYTLMTDLSPLTGKTDFLRLTCNDCVGITLPDFTGWTQLQQLSITFCELDDIPDVTSCTSLQYFRAGYNNFGPDDCPLIQAIGAMGIGTFIYNPQADDSTLICP